MTQETGTRALAVPTPAERFSQLQAQLNAFPRDQYNWLVPTSAQEISPFFRPVIVTVKIDPNSDDVYEPAGRGKLALHAHALQRVSNGTGITWEEPRLAKPGRWTWVASIAGWWTHPNGERVRQPGIYTLDVEDDGVIVKRTRAKIGKQSGNYTFSAADAERDIDSIRQFGGQRAVTGAQSIVIRKCNGMKATYTKDELAKPFVCVMFRPDEQIPEVRAALAERIRDRDRQVFGAQHTVTDEVRELPPVASSEAEELEAVEREGAPAVNTIASAPAPAAAAPEPEKKAPAEPPVVRDEAPKVEQQQLATPPVGPEAVIRKYQARLEEFRAKLTSQNGAPWSTAARTKAPSERQVGMVAGMIAKPLNLNDEDAKAARRAILAALWGVFNDYSELNSDQVSCTIDWAKAYPQEVVELHAALQALS